jgi:hypothetical protein
MRQVDIELKGWMIADAMAELRIWLDHNNCVPLSFDISKLPSGGIRVRVEFSDDAMADAFEREFGR